MRLCLSHGKQWVSTSCCCYPAQTVCSACVASHLPSEPYDQGKVSFVIGVLKQQENQLGWGS